MCPINIYFAGAIRGGRDDVKIYQILPGILNKYGTVLTEHIGNETLLMEESGLTGSEIFTRDMRWLAVTDLLVADISTPSLGMECELAMAENLNIPSLYLFRKQKKQNALRHDSWKSVFPDSSISQFN